MLADVEVGVVEVVVGDVGDVVASDMASDMAEAMEDGGIWNKVKEVRAVTVIEGTGTRRR